MKKIEIEITKLARFTKSFIIEMSDEDFRNDDEEPYRAAEAKYGDSDISQWCFEGEEYETAFVRDVAADTPVGPKE